MHCLTPTAVRRGLLLWLLAISTGSLVGAPVINEFMAANDSSLRDEDGDYSDWVEIHNPDGAAVSLAGYYLTDEATNLRKWAFPPVTLAPGGYLVVFASGKDRTDPAAPLHTDFKLAAEGEYLALVAPDGFSVISDYAPAYPPQFEDESFGIAAAAPPPGWTFFTAPTPGAPNGTGLRAGPAIQVIEPNPPQPVTGPLTLTARVTPVNAPVAGVRLFYRQMFAGEHLLEMQDDGSGGDAAAGDGVWTAVIPADAFVPGLMTRWRFAAEDAQGTGTIDPPYRDPQDSPRYYGTVAADERIQSRLTVFHWFTTSLGGAGTSTGARGSVYYEGEFYDNVLFTLHGQSSAGFPKKSYNIDFNRPQRFQWSPESPRVADIDLLTNWADKSKVRHVIAYEVMRLSGVPAHFAYTVRVQLNGSFFSTADFVEDADEVYLERAGLNPDGALYKVYSNLLNRDAGDTANAGVEKKTRLDEDNSDLQELINGLDLTGTTLERYLYDHIDIPRCVNLLAANSVIRNIDMHSKNWYIYCDTGRSEEWAILPWDLDLSYGRFWNPTDTYFDNRLYTDGYVVTGTAIRLVAQMFGNPDMRAMIMRRIRTLSDRYLAPPPEAGTDENDLYCERRLNEQLALIDPPDIVPSDAQRDFEKWGSWLQGGTVVAYDNPSPAVESMVEAIDRWKTEYLPARRSYLYNTQTVDHGGEIPLPQVGGGPTVDYTPLVVAGARVRALVPADSSLGWKWIGVPTLEPFDDSSWLSGVTGVGYERGTGYESLIGLNVDTQMRQNNSVFLRIEFDLADPSAIDQLELRMKYDDGFVAFLNGTLLVSANSPEPLSWDSAALHSQEANRNAYMTFDVTDKKFSLRAGRNILAIQGLNDSLSSSDLLFVPELHAGTVVPPSTGEPEIEFGTIESSPASGDQDEEYIELRNPHSIAVDISDWQLAGAIAHTFLGGTVLPPNGRLYVCPSAAAFRARAVSPRGGEGLFVQGGYQGHLTGLGGTVALLDTAGNTNNTATFEAQPSDPQRYLVVSELMYHPVVNAEAEFIELLNISETTTLDLAGIRFTQGVDFDFTGSDITSLPPGVRVLVVRDLAAFESVYGTGLPIAGAFANGTALSNGGELLRLEDAGHDTIREFAYADAAPWPDADGNGFSLVLVAPETNPDHALPENWRTSTRTGGSPGGPDATPFEGDPMADTDGNGERDLIDYALGNDLGGAPIPTRIELHPAGPGEAQELWLLHPISLVTTGVELGVSFSTDLVTWEDAGTSLERISQTPLGDGRALVTWRVKPPLDGAPRLFLRLRATQP